MCMQRIEDKIFGKQSVSLLEMISTRGKRSRGTAVKEGVGIEEILVLELRKGGRKQDEHEVNVKVNIYWFRMYGREGRDREKMKV